MRSIANTTISFGAFVNVPVKVYPATGSQDVKLNLCAPDGSPVEQVYRKIGTDEIVGTTGDCSKSFNGKLLSDDAMANINQECKMDGDVDISKVLNIDSFIPLSAIPFYRVTNWYYIAPNNKEATAKGYATLLAAMEKKKTAAIVKWVNRTRQSIMAIYPENGVLYAVTLAFQEDCRETPDDYDSLGETQTVKAEVDMATTLIDTIYDPDAEAVTTLKDTARDKRRELIESVAAGGEVTVSEAAPAQPATDLMADLEAAVEAAKDKPKRKAAKKSKAKAAA